MKLPLCVSVRVEYTRFHAGGRIWARGMNVSVEVLRSLRRVA